MSGSRPPRWDAGVQNERTALAWRRTATALCVVVLLLGRTTLYDNAALAGGVTICGLVAAAWIALQSDSRYRRAAIALPANAPLPDGRALFLCSAFCVVLGVLAIAGLAG